MLYKKCLSIVLCIIVKMFSLLEVIEDLYKMINERSGKLSPMISEYTYNIVMANAEVIIILYFTNSK